jgi:hypothetical protein
MHDITATIVEARNRFNQNRCYLTNNNYIITYFYLGDWITTDSGMKVLLKFVTNKFKINPLPFELKGFDANEDLLHIKTQIKNHWARLHNQSIMKERKATANIPPEATFIIDQLLAED